MERVAGVGVNQQVFEHLGLGILKGGYGCGVESISELAQNLLKLEVVVVLIGDVVVEVEIGEHTEARCISNESYGNERGSVVVGGNGAGAHIGHRNISVIVDNGQLDVVTD